jgi:23S rRNA (uracil1939-C5)-methyltransferase
LIKYGQTLTLIDSPTDGNSILFKHRINTAFSTYFSNMKAPVKKGDVLENQLVEDLTSEGQGIVRLDKFVIFVDGAAPGDCVDLSIRYVKKNYAESVIQKIITPSAERVQPNCEHFGTCGGCKMQHIRYERQLSLKQTAVHNALQRIGKLEFPEVQAIKGAQEIYAYRNRLDYACSSKRWMTTAEIETGLPMTEPALGFHVPGRFDKVIDINSCHLQADLSNRIRNDVRKYALENGLSFFNTISQEGFLRNLIIRSSSTNEWMVIVVFKEDNHEQRMGLLNHLTASFPEITSLLYIINGKRNDTIFDQEVLCHHGRDHIFEEMEGLRFKISAKSFYQTNSGQALELYRIVRSFAGLTGSENVYDLYTGTGTIALFLARNAKHVAGIDYISDAIEDAKANAVRNTISNVAFRSGDLKETLNEDFITTYGRPDVIVTDPPRSGMHEDVVRKLIELAPPRIVYVSCNPSTQARDLQLLSEKYRIEKVQPVDMFPHTTHVENVVLLESRS